ncbi:MAG TPA: caspase family protein [Chthoniobacterales bacterium]|nr:caspase family protein [Chthoniobacterales bacterium]
MRSARVAFLVFALLIGDFRTASAREYANDELGASRNVPAHALVVGNREYIKPLPLLPAADKDAKVMAALLASLGFDVIVRVNVSQVDFMKEILELSKRAKIGHKYGIKPLVVLYFSGHGFVDDDGRQFMVGVDARNGGKSIEEAAVGVEDAIDILSKESIAVALVDACRSDFHIDPDRDQGISATANPPMRPSGVPLEIAAPDADYLVGYANQRGASVSGYVDKDDHNSPYSEGLVRYLGNDHPIEFELGLVHDYMVRLKIHHDPRVDPHISGDVYASYSAGFKEIIEKEWATIKKTPTEESVRVFILRYRNGPFVPAATRWEAAHGSAESLP